MEDFKSTQGSRGKRPPLPLVKMQSTQEHNQVLSGSTSCLEKEFTRSLNAVKKAAELWQASNLCLNLVLRAVAQGMLRAILPGGKKTLFDSTPILQEGHLQQFAFNQLWAATDKPGGIFQDWPRWMRNLSLILLSMDEMS